MSIGIYCLDPEVLDFITSGECDFAKNVFPRLINEGKRLFGYLSGDYWADIGSLDGSLEATRHLLKMKPKNEGSISELCLHGKGSYG